MQSRDDSLWESFPRALLIQEGAGAKGEILVFLLTIQTSLFCITRCLHFSCRLRCALVWGMVVRGFVHWDLC